MIYTYILSIPASVSRRENETCESCSASPFSQSIAFRPRLSNEELVVGVFHCCLEPRLVPRRIATLRRVVFLIIQTLILAHPPEEFSPKKTTSTSFS